jgi:electron transport complex protein RnfG
MITRTDIIKIAFNLVVVYVTGGLVLALVYAATSPVIGRNAEIEKAAALRRILPEAEKIEKLGQWIAHETPCEYYSAQKNSAVCGYIVESYGRGYSSQIHLLIAVDTMMRIVRLEVLSQSETPGLGDAVESNWFKGQFNGKSIAQMNISKTPTETGIQAITGATISSRAVTEDAARNALDCIEHAVKRNMHYDAAQRADTISGPRS